MMCCDRGYNSYTEKLIERCHCKYHWCCYVTCKKCERMVERYVCKWAPRSSWNFQKPSTYFVFVFFWLPSPMGYRLPKALQNQEDLLLTLASLKEHICFSTSFFKLPVGLISLITNLDVKHILADIFGERHHPPVCEKNYMFPLSGIFNSVLL